MTIELEAPNLCAPRRRPPRAVEWGIDTPTGRIPDEPGEGAPMGATSLLRLLDELLPIARAMRLSVRGRGERAYERLLATSEAEAWLIAWGPSTALDFHDHGGSAGAFEVLGGSLVETSTDLCTRAALRSQILGAGRRSCFGPTRVHEVWNPSGRSGLSLHVYSPPLVAMTFYDTRPEAFLEPLHTVEAEGQPEPPALAG